MPVPENSVYFGNLRKAAWVPAPMGGLGASSVGTSDQMDYANGGAFVSQSAGAHREFDFSWPTGQESDFRFLREYREGDNGTGLMYWVDPMAMDVNAFPPHVARPELSGRGWPSLLGAGMEPTLVSVGSVRTNLATNPNFEVNTLGWTAENGTILTRDTVSPIAGTASAKITNGGDIYTITAGAVAGESWTFSLDYKTSGTVTGSPRLYLTDMVNAPILAFLPLTQTTASRFSVTMTVGAGATQVNAAIFGPNLAGVIWIDNVLIEKSSTLGTYFDGSTVFVDGRAGAWTGTPNASTSTLLDPINNMPRMAAKYTLSAPVGTVAQRKTVLIIPPEHTLHLGYSGSSTNGGVVRVQPILTSGAYGPTQDLTLLAPTGTTRLNASFSGALYSAVLIYVTQTTTGTATVTLTSAKAVYSMTGITPVLTGSHVKGVGHSGMRFSSGPTFAYIYYNDDAGKKYVSAAAKFTEVGSWI